MFLVPTGTLVSQDLDLAWLWTDPIAAVKPNPLSETSTSVLSQQQTSILSQQRTSVLSQQQTSVLSQQKTSILSQQKTQQQPAGGRQLSRLAETGQMSAVQTRQMLKSQTRGRASQKQWGLSKAKPSPNPGRPKFRSGPNTSNLPPNGSRIDGLDRNKDQMNPKGCPDPSGPLLSPKTVKKRLLLRQGSALS